MGSGRPQLDLRKIKRFPFYFFFFSLRWSPSRVPNLRASLLFQRHKSFGHVAFDESALCPDPFSGGFPIFRIALQSVAFFAHEHALALMHDVVHDQQPQIASPRSGGTIHGSLARSLIFLLHRHVKQGAIVLLAPLAAKVNDQDGGQHQSSTGN